MMFKMRPSPPQEKVDSIIKYLKSKDPNFKAYIEGIRNESVE